MYKLNWPATNLHPFTKFILYNTEIIICNRKRHLIDAIFISSVLLLLQSSKLAWLLTEQHNYTTSKHDISQLRMHIFEYFLFLISIQLHLRMIHLRLVQWKTFYTKGFVSANLLYLMTADLLLKKLCLQITDNLFHSSDCD